VRHEDLSNGRGELINAGARNDDRIASAVRFFGDAKKLSALVFAQLRIDSNEKTPSGCP
jgi:hypothetical protein